MSLVADSVKNKFIIVDLNTMDFMKNSEGALNYYDTEDEAHTVSGCLDFKISLQLHSAFLRIIVWT